MRTLYLWSAPDLLCVWTAGTFITLTCLSQAAKAAVDCLSMSLELSVPIPLAGATFGSFLIALLHILLELFVYQTISPAKAAQPAIIAGKQLFCL